MLLSPWTVCHLCTALLPRKETCLVTRDKISLFRPCLKCPQGYTLRGSEANALSMTQLFPRALLPIRHSLSCLILYRVLNFSSHPFEALKFSSCICSATATAFACSMGPETGMFLLLAILNHSNIAFLLAAFPFVANLSSNFCLSHRVD